MTPRARRGTYRPQPPLASLRATGGQRQDSAARIVRPHPPASIDRILTHVPRLTDAVAGAEIEGDFAFLAGGLLLGGR
jgi:hypothetical protein